MNFDEDKKYQPPGTRPVRNQGVEHQQEGIQFEYEDQEEDIYDNYVDGTEQQIEMMEFQDSKAALENMVTDLEHFNEKFAHMSIK